MYSLSLESEVNQTEPAADDQNNFNDDVITTFKLSKECVDVEIAEQPALLNHLVGLI
jgi:hypothetical protein